MVLVSVKPTYVTNLCFWYHNEKSTKKLSQRNTDVLFVVNHEDLEILAVNVNLQNLWTPLKSSSELASCPRAHGAIDEQASFMVHD